MGLSEEQYFSAHRRFYRLKQSPTRTLCEVLVYNAYVDEDRRYHPEWMRISSECESGVLELVNWINNFAKRTSDLEVWSQVLDECEDKDTRFLINFEIVSPIAFLTLSFPAAIRGKLAFITARAIRDLFKVKKSNGKFFEDHHLTEDLIKNFYGQADNEAIKIPLDDFSRQLSEIDNYDFRSATKNYRNRANHQIAPNIEFGRRLIFATLVGEGVEGFSFGVENPLRLRDLIGPLKQQHEVCCRAFKSFWNVAIQLNNSMRVENDVYPRS